MKLHHLHNFHFIASSPSSSQRWGVPKPGCFKPGCLQILCRSAFLRSFAPVCALCALLRTCVCALLRAFAYLCVRRRLERPHLGNAEKNPRGNSNTPPLSRYATFVVHTLWVFTNINGYERVEGSHQQL